MRDAELAERICEFLDAAEARSDLETYFTSYSGRVFETIGGRGDVPGVANRFMASDLVAVTTLGVTVSGHGAIELLDGDRSATLAALLEEIRVDVDLWDASDDDLAALYELQEGLDLVPSVAHVIRSKLLARKRPRLVPIRDRYVLTALVGRDHGNFTEPLRAALQDAGLRARLEDLRTSAPAGTDISLLRVLDVVVWMAAHGREYSGQH